MVGLDGTTVVVGAGTDVVDVELVEVDPSGSVVVVVVVVVVDGGAGTSRFADTHHSGPTTGLHRAGVPPGIWAT